LRGPDHRTARKRGEARHQLLEGERLHQIVVPAGLESVDAVVDSVEVGQEEHRRGHAILAHEGHDAKTVELRQHAVKHDDVEALGARAFVTLPAVARDRRLMTARKQARRNEPGGSFIVLDHQNLHAADLAELLGLTTRFGGAFRFRPAISPDQAALGSQIRHPQSRPTSPETAMQDDGATNSLHSPQRWPSPVVVT
jgi:hypothetical protein